MRKEKPLVWVWPILTALLATRWVYDFYFWHDDFAVFYGVRQGIDILGWPYENFGLIFNNLFKILGYWPTGYFALGVGLFLIYLVTFIYWMKQIFDEVTGFWLGMVLATGYVGAGVFLEAYDPIISFPPLIGLIISLLMFMFFLRKGQKNAWWYFGGGCLALGFGVAWFQARTSTFLVPPIVWFLLFSERGQLRKVLLGILGVVVIFVVAFVWVPLGWNVPNLGGALVEMAVLEEVKHFVLTVGSLIFTDEMRARFWPGMSDVVYERKLVIMMAFIIGGFLCLAYKKRKNKRLIKLWIFSGMWVGFMLLPYLLRTDWRMETVHRYVIFVYPGILLFWGSLGKGRWWKVLTIAMVASNLIWVNKFLGDHHRRITRHADFYRRLHTQLPELTEGGIYFFDYPQDLASDFGDYFRVGTFPSEAALATEYGFPYKKITLVTDNSTLRNVIEDGLKADHFFSYYDDGQRIFETSDLARKALWGGGIMGGDKVLREMTTEFAENKSGWTGERDEIEIRVDNFVPLMPFVLKFRATSFIPVFPIPYTEGCEGDCREESVVKRRGKVLDFLGRSGAVKSGMSVVADSFGEGTVAGAMIDRDFKTTWTANRQDWFEGWRPELVMSFLSPVDLVGVILVSSSLPHTPETVELSIDGQPTEVQRESIDGGVIYRWRPKRVAELSLRIIETLGRDQPVINELLPMPVGIEALNLVELETVEKNPAAYISQEEEKAALTKYLRQNSLVCVRWEAEGYGSGLKEVVLNSDGGWHDYEVELPVMGAGVFKITIGCAKYPLNLRLMGYELHYLEIRD